MFNYKLKLNKENIYINKLNVKLLDVKFRYEIFACRILHTLLN